MRHFGFSTGALAYSNFQEGLRFVLNQRLKIVELSALRYSELAPLVRAIPSLDLARFRYISVHAPSKFDSKQELEVINLLQPIAAHHWHIVLHPDTIHDFSAWQCFGSLLLIENMDKRYATGRTMEDLEVIFSKLPKAGLCFDLGHCRQVDPTMNESVLILRRFRSRLRQLHVSEVNSRSKHDPLSCSSIGAFGRIAHLIPENVPVVLESPVEEIGIQAEIEKARLALTPENFSIGRKHETRATAEAF